MSSKVTVDLARSWAGLLALAATRQGLEDSPARVLDAENLCPRCTYVNYDGMHQLLVLVPDDDNVRQRRLAPGYPET